MNRLLNTESVANPAAVIDANFQRLDKSLMAVSFDLDYSSFTATATAETITVANLPAGSIVMGIVMENNEAWTGGSASAATIEFGTTGDDDKYLSATDVFSSPSGVFDSSGILFLPGGPGTVTPFKATLRTTGDDVENLTAGNLTVKILYVTV